MVDTAQNMIMNVVRGSSQIIITVDVEGEMVLGSFSHFWMLRYPSECNGSCNLKVASPSPVSGLGPL